MLYGCLFMLFPWLLHIYLGLWLRTQIRRGSNQHVQGRSKISQHLRLYASPPHQHPTFHLYTCRFSPLSLPGVQSAACLVHFTSAWNGNSAVWVVIHKTMPWFHIKQKQCGPVRLQIALLVSKLKGKPPNQLSLLYLGLHGASYGQGEVIQSTVISLPLILLPAVLEGKLAKEALHYLAVFHPQRWFKE